VVHCLGLLVSLSLSISLIVILHARHFEDDELAQNVEESVMFSVEEIPRTII